MAFFVKMITKQMSFTGCAGCVRRIIDTNAIDWTLDSLQESWRQRIINDLKSCKFTPFPNNKMQLHISFRLNKHKLWKANRLNLITRDAEDPSFGYNHFVICLEFVYWRYVALNLLLSN